MKKVSYGGKEITDFQAKMRRKWTISQTQTEQILKDFKIAGVTVMLAALLGFTLGQQCFNLNLKLNSTCYTHSDNALVHQYLLNSTNHKIQCRRINFDAPDLDSVQDSNQILHHWLLTIRTNSPHQQEAPLHKGSFLLRAFQSSLDFKIHRAS